jgi:methylthioribulose-1-phosphate dehydratase
MNAKTLSTKKPSAQNPAALGDREARELICDLCRHFYELGWASGTGGGVSVRSGDKIYMAPSGVQKERMHPEDMFVLDLKGEVLQAPASQVTVSACRPLFMHAFQLRNAGAVLHSHSMNAMLATLISGNTFRITGVEMLKGIAGVGVFDVHEVPIIDNTAYECDLADSLKEAIIAYPKSNAVLVRGHGVYIWGKDWVQAKTQAECYDYLFEAAVKMKQLGINPEGGKK